MVYYNRILKRWIVDQLDLFLISFSSTYLLTLYFKNASETEKAKLEKVFTERLKDSILTKTKLLSPEGKVEGDIGIRDNPNDIEPSGRLYPKKFTKKIPQIIPRVINWYRGGKDIELDRFIPSENPVRAFKAFLVIILKYKTKIENLLVFLKQVERNSTGSKKYLFLLLNFLLKFSLNRFNIGVDYYFERRGMTFAVGVKTVCAGGITGLYIAWTSYAAFSGGRSWNHTMVSESLCYKTSF